MRAREAQRMDGMNESQIRSIGWLHNENPNTVTLTIVLHGGALPIRKVINKQDFFNCKGDKSEIYKLVKEL